MTDTTEPGRPAPLADLPDLTLEQLPPALREAVARAGWTALMPVQARGIPYLMAGREVAAGMWHATSVNRSPLRSRSGSQ